MTTTQEKPRDSSYDITNAEDPPRGRHVDDWRASTTLWMLAVALLLWLVTYLLTVVLAVYLDYGVRSVVTLTWLFGWSNGTSTVSLNEDNTHYLVTY